jgi:sporulation protein YlmC with PRC-barrel domain
MVLASALPEKPVLSADGRELGTVHNLTLEPRTGTLRTLLVETDRTEVADLETTPEGHLRVPAAMISGVGDQVIVSLPD